jgi:hypothetical protein
MNHRTMHSNMSPPAAAANSGRYVAAMEELVDAVQQLSQARNVGAIAAIVRDAARRLTGGDDRGHLQRRAHPR